jgi:K+-dependent Na+/Ca+ exchanger-like protein
VNIILSLLVIALAVYLLAIITDEYFIVSLDQISQRLKIPSDVAGASLMAMGSSAPELFIALLALFIAGGTHGDVGIGTIVGSAIFNILVITGMSAVAHPVSITWRVIVRDVVMYTLSLALLIYAVFDGQITLWETLLFISLYAIYIFVLFNWKSEEVGDPVVTVSEEIDEQRENPGLYFRITAGVSRAIGFVTGDPERSYWRAFAVSIAFIAVLSYFLVEYAVLFADALSVPPVIVALTILAAGTSVPDLFASVVVARQGRGDMAVANAVGSNVFDILIGLGLPWLVVLVAQGGVVEIGTADLFTSTLILLGTVVLLFIFLTSGHRLSRLEGAILLLAYAAYVIWVWVGN